MPRFLTRRLGLILPPLLLCGCGNVNEDLVEAAAVRDNDAINVLTAEGADPSTALIMALQRGRVDAVQSLLDNGADPSSKDETGAPAVVVAAKLGQTESVRALTGGVSTLDDVDADNRTALMWAVENGYPEIVSLLIEAGADVDVEDANGRTALVLAEDAGKTEIALLFRACRVGQELNPGESCDVSGVGTLGVRADGCLGELPDLGGGLSVGNMSISISGGETTTCMRGYYERGGFRTSEIPDTSRWRIDALP